VQIRPFTMQDYGAVLALWQNAGPGIRVRPSDRPEELAKKLTRDPELFLVAEEDGGVVGVILGAWDGRRGWLHHLAVAEAYRGRGIGRALVAAVEQGLRAKGCMKVNLLVHRENVAAQRLYRELGYEESPFVPMGKEL
jgi:ribosomal protein S18 acetylase RimI-like enzyme